MEHIQLDSRAIRVLAHPLRARLLSELRVNGAATATQLAERLSTNTGATSYHLRKLAEVNLVVETGEGTGKQRFWAPAQEAHGWSDADFADDPDAAAAAGWLRQHYQSFFAEKMARWEDERQHWPVEWRDAAHSSDALLTATAAELDELMTELESVVLRFKEQLGDEQRPGARRVSVQLHSIPIDLDDRP
jgi:DNA-binding transcriptional ArsR family regulator